MIADPALHGIDGALARRIDGARRVALVLALGVLLLPSLGLYPLFDVDEGAFGEATRELLQSGDWISTTLNGAPRYDKPILVYWLQALSVRALGLDEFALRLPSALASLAWILALARFAAPRLGARSALMAAWIAGTCLGVQAIARAATADALLNVLLAASMFDLWRHLEDGSRAPLRRCYAWMALGALTKGPVALLIPGAASLAYCASAGRWRDWLRAAADPPGWLILCALAGPWYVVQWLLHGRGFVDGFLVRHNLERFQGTLEGHGGGLAYYFVVVPLLLLPWSGLLWRALRHAPIDWGDPLGRYLMAWFTFVFVFFSLSGTKLPHYLLYGMTPLFLLLASRAHDPGRAWTLLLGPLLLLALLPFLPYLAQRWSEHSGGTGFYALQAQRALQAAPLAYYVVTLACALAALALALQGRRPASWRAAGAAILLCAALGYAFTPWLGAVLNAPVRDAARVAARLPEEAVQWQIAAPSFSVYRRRVTPARPPQAGELAITRLDRLDPAAPVERLFSEGGVALVRRRAQDQ